MTHNTFYVIAVESNGRYHAYAQTINNSNNLVGIFPTNAIHINACDTLKDAKRIVEAWNAGWKAEGKWLYGSTQKEVAA